jgi:hypothetical protein
MMALSAETAVVWAQDGPGAGSEDAGEHEMTAPTPTRVHGAASAAGTVVVSSHKVRDADPAARYAWLPYGTQHGWRPGTRRTLCGELMTGWEVFWERRFTGREGTACAGCVEMSLPEVARRRLDPRQGSVRRLPEPPSRLPGRAVPRAS